jgi:murein DD-endopeptidase MepM/ murein hydrolase activator NlpD
MRSTRYTILIANRKTGAVRRLTLSRRFMVLSLSGMLAVPALMAFGFRGASVAEVEALQAANDALTLENASYRDATGELTEQIASLQTALTELGEQAELDPATRRAIDRLPAVVRARAVGGPTLADFTAATTAAGTPETTFDILRDLLGSLENRLVSVKARIEGQQALARATPTIWPVIGRLSSYYGNRKDPFTGGPDFHTGLDIGANQGSPIRATADGTVESAAYNGNYGNAVLLGHGFGISTRFGHLSRYAVRPGQQVKRGDVIGYVGRTGRATSPHLHYEILLNGRPINPLTLLTRP